MKYDVYLLGNIEPITVDEVKAVQVTERGIYFGGPNGITKLYVPNWNLSHYIAKADTAER